MILIFNFIIPAVPPPVNADAAAESCDNRPKALGVPMKLIYICRHLTLLGGQSRIAWELAERALKENNEVHFVARRFPADIKNHKISTHRIFQWPNFFGEAARFRTFASLSSREAARLAGAGSVIHGFGDSYRQDILTLGNVDWNYAQLIPGRVPSETAVHVKTKSFKDPSLRFLVLVSDHQRKEVLNLIPDFDPSKIRVIFPGVDAQRFALHSRESIRARLHRERGIPLDSKWLVFAAGGDFEKRNIATLNKALLRLRHRPDWRMIFIGGRKDQIPWPKELEGRGHFLGRLGDIGTVLPGCDLMVYPAWYEEFGLVCLEAMASGLPLAVCRTVGCSELVSPTHKEAGVLKDPADAAQLAQIIETLLTNDPLRHRLSDENRKIAQEYSWDHMFRKYKTLYEEVAATRRE